MVLIAGESGTTKALERSDEDLCAETGMMRSAGLKEVSSVKKVAVRVVYQEPVYVSSTMLPMSNMIFCGSLKRERKLVMSFS